MSEPDPINPLAHLAHDIMEIPNAGLKVNWKASPNELAGLKTALGVLEVEAAAIKYEIKRKGRARRGGERYIVSGELDTRLLQACVVTLEPISQRIVEKIDDEFRPQDDMKPKGEEESDILSVNDPEPIVEGKLEIGRLIFAYLSAALDPFPRKEGESLDWRDLQDPADLASENPFAALAKLKDKT